MLFFVFASTSIFGFFVSSAAYTFADAAKTEVIIKTAIKSTANNLDFLLSISFTSLQYIFPFP